MNIIRSLFQKFIKLLVFLWKRVGRCFPDEFYLKILYRLLMGKQLNLNKPQTFNEKLQWLKLHDHNPVYTTMVDKYAVKNYVARIIGDQYIIPTLGVWERVEDIDWGALPEQFVLKCTHDSGGLVICTDKSCLNRKKAEKKLKSSLRRNYFKEFREWPYKNVPRRIIAEQYLEPALGNKDIPDYKFFCFDGEVKAMFVATERQFKGVDVKFDFFDADYNHLPFRQGHDHAEVLPKKPKQFELMKHLAERLSKGFPHVRVDFYQIGDLVYFGELTLYHFTGMMPFEPKVWDKILGDMITLPIDE